LSADDSGPARILLFFIDGVGLGSSDPTVNPVAAAGLPNLRSILGGGVPLLEATESGSHHSAWASLGRADAALGVEGRPQSGTGQAALLTGKNVASRIGRHFGPWVPTALRDLLARENLFTRTCEKGLRVGFANAYPRGHMETGGRGTRRPAAFPLAARAAGVLSRDEFDVRRGTALTSSITTDPWRRYVDPDAPRMTASDAGRLFASMSASYDLLVFAHYDTDHAGHSKSLSGGIAAIERVDAFLGGVLDALPADALLLITSDHGNLEDVRGGHTRAPVPFLAFGPGSRKAVDRVGSITDIAPVVGDILEKLPRVARKGGYLKR